MEHSRSKLGAALFCFSGALGLGLLADCIPLRSLFAPGGDGLFLGGGILAALLLCAASVLAYRASGAGQFALSAVFSALRGGFLLLLVPDFSGGMRLVFTLAGALCLCIALWCCLSGTAAALRVSGEAPLAGRAKLLRGLVLFHAAAAALTYLAAAIPAAPAALIFYHSYIYPLILLSVILYSWVAGVRLRRVKEVDPKQIEEIRRRLQ